MRILRHILIASALVALAACSGGAATTVNPTTAPPTVADYTGPAPSTADVQAFRINLWDNVKANNRCGGCHNATGQAPRFARNDDVNLAYADANAVVNLTQPDQSKMVLKVAGGHNCWLSSNSACGDILTTWIKNWAGSAAGGGTQIALQAPNDVDVGATKTFPAMASDNGATSFANTVWPLVRGAGNCLRCHAPNAATPQSPFFASADVNESYAAARAKIDLDTPAISRLVVRLGEESHNCWTTSCSADAATMLARINQFVGGIQVAPVDPTKTAYGYVLGRPTLLVDPRGLGTNYIPGWGKFDVDPCCGPRTAAPVRPLPEDGPPVLGPPVAPGGSTAVDAIYWPGHVLKIPDNCNAHLRCLPATGLPYLSVECIPGPGLPLPTLYTSPSPLPGGWPGYR